jgi:hypothetical protein
MTGQMTVMSNSMRDTNDGVHIWQRVAATKVVVGDVVTFTAVRLASATRPCQPLTEHCSSCKHCTCH